MYQNVVIDGVDRGDNPNKKYSSYWNEGKWNNFIRPLLPDPADGTFVEIGCNAGMYPKMAKEYGFRDVIGIEPSNSAFKMALEYRGQDDYKLLHRGVGTNFSFDELPVADVVLLSTVHYYFDLNAWMKFLDELQYKTVYCVVVSRPLKKFGHWMPGATFSDVRNYFKNWEEVGAIPHFKSQDDPHPRELYSLCFKSTLRRRWDLQIDVRNSDGVDQGAADLAQMVASSDTVNPYETTYFSTFKTRKNGRWSDEKIAQFVQSKIDVMYDVKNNGLRHPLLVQMWGKISDGGNRYRILNALGYKSAISRII